VVQRQPTHRHIVGTHGERLADGADVREKIGMREEDAFWVAGTAGGVLDEGRIARLPSHRRFAWSGFTEAVDRRDVLERWHRSAQQLGDSQGLRECHEHTRARIPEDAALPMRVFFDLVRPEWWIHRHRHGSSDERSKEGWKECGLGPEHDRHGIAAPYAQRAQAGSHAFRRRQQLAVANRRFLLIFAKMDVNAIWCSLGMPVQDVDERRR
jgi:hypothetical protein